MKKKTEAVPPPDPSPPPEEVNRDYYPGEASDSPPPVTLGMELTIDYGVVRATFHKSISTNPRSMLEQHSEYDRLSQQLEFEVQEWAKNRLPKIRPLQ